MNTVTSAWVKIFAIAAAGGLGIWLLESKVAKHEGLPQPGTPGVPTLGAPPPSFASQGGYTASAGPVTFGSGVASGTGGSVQAPEYPPPQPSYRSSYGRRERGPGIRERRATRQANIAQSRADIAIARQQAAAADAKRRGGYRRTRVVAGQNWY